MKLKSLDETLVDLASLADVDAKQGIMVTSTKSDASYVQSDIFGMSRQDGLLSGKNLLFSGRMD